MVSSPLQLASVGLLFLGLVGLGPSSRAISVSDVVKAFCLSAYQADLLKEGKRVSPALLDRTCSCVGERVAQGSDVEEAHIVCGRPLGAALIDQRAGDRLSTETCYVSHT